MEYTLETLEVYKLAESFSDKIWMIVGQWDFFTKDTIGKQMVKAADSISANIAEGYGRYFFKESKQFYFYRKGLILETKAWLSKCQRRSLVNSERSAELLAEAELLLLKLNAFIKFLSKSQSISPDKPWYGSICKERLSPINKLTFQQFNQSTCFLYLTPCDHAKHHTANSLPA